MWDTFTIMGLAFDGTNQQLLIGTGEPISAGMRVRQITSEQCGETRVIRSVLSLGFTGRSNSATTIAISTSRGTI
jgi:hypothetical protein